MRVTTLTCDKCGKRIHDSDGCYSVEPVATVRRPQVLTFVRKSVDLCRECMVVLFDFAPKRDGPPKPEPQLTALEVVEMLANLLRQDAVIDEKAAEIERLKAEIQQRNYASANGEG